MEIFEKLYDEYLLLTIEDFFDLQYVVSDITSLQIFICEEKIKEKSLEFIKYLLESNMFDVGTVEEGESRLIFVIWNLNIDESLKK